MRATRRTLAARTAVRQKNLEGCRKELANTRVQRDKAIETVNELTARIADLSHELKKKNSGEHEVFDLTDD